MDEKQKLIMEMAQKLFDEKGLHSTSIGDIVKKCKISKATFYKYFATKENLIYELMAFFNKKFFQITNSINLDNISEEEKLRKKIIIVWKYIFSQSIFNAYIMENFPNNQGEEILNLRKKARLNMEREYYNSLIKTYGEDVKPIIWELVFYLDALIHQFIYVIRVNKKDIKPEIISDFIVSGLNFIIRNKESFPSLEEKIFYLQDEKISKIDRKKAFKENILLLKSKLEKSDLKNKNKLLEALEIINKEFNKEISNSLLIEGMLALLEKEKSITNEVKTLCYLNNEGVK